MALSITDSGVFEVHTASCAKICAKLMEQATMLRYLRSVQGKAAALLAGAFAVGSLATAALAWATSLGDWSWLVAIPLGVVAALLVARQALLPWVRLLRALEAVVASYREGDFSTSLVSDRDDEFGRLITAHNEFAQALREQRRDLVERELLLDTVVQNTPVALVLVEGGGHRVAFANLAARQLFNSGVSLHGLDFRTLLAPMPPRVSELIAASEDALFTATLAGVEETFHLSQRRFSLQGRPSQLYLFRRMTRELSRQEVAIWKKVIRVMTHEINNSLAPISSMAHSGAELVRRADYAQLPKVLASIRTRAEHLHQFIDGYARFSKLPAPRRESIEWPEFINSLAGQIGFDTLQPLPAASASFDRAQIEQVLINLIRNAHEAGSVAAEVKLSVQRVGHEFQLTILDRGGGMNDTVLANALLPFYSTKRSGTGLGLALAREVIEAHGGRIQLSNRAGGGACVLLVLPDLPGDGALRSELTEVSAKEVSAKSGATQTGPKIAN
jgi:nitrogen fixation/metabolism regulation signal transduction histidine kinase